LAGLVSWKQVSPLPFEAAALPQSMYRLIRLPVVSYAIPALVAIGQVREHFLSVKNPLRWPLRKLAIAPSLDVLRKMQPKSGGYLEAIPLTSFVLMSLAAKGLAEHPVSKSAIRFLESSVREDGSWPIDTNLATWVTSLATAACLPSSSRDNPIDSAQSLVSDQTIAWLLSCQHRQRHPFTGSEPGGWGWSDLSGAVPDADDTPAAMLALHRWYMLGKNDRELNLQIESAAKLGIKWLLALQNRDGGWPTFCRGWGALPFDRSGSDLTAHAMRALYVWHEILLRSGPSAMDRTLERIPKAISRGWHYLQNHQRPNGSWLPLWFGNQDDAEETNPIYGTSRVLMAVFDCGYQQSDAALRGIEFLHQSQNADGGWGGGPSINYLGQTSGSSTIEETAQTIEVLSRCLAYDDPVMLAGVRWLTEAVKNEHFQAPQPIGFYFAKLWYYEQMYPIVYTLAAFKGVRRTMID
jgi:squalene-hopene/tetraprenyl-beta-curcumene cyclase